MLTIVMSGNGSLDNAHVCMQLIIAHFFYKLYIHRRRDCTAPCWWGPKAETALQGLHLLSFGTAHLIFHTCTCTCTYVYYCKLLPHALVLLILCYIHVHNYNFTVRWLFSNYCTLLLCGDFLIIVHYCHMYMYIVC